MHQIISEEVEYCKLLFKCELDADIIQTKKSEIVSKLKSRKVPGYRDGHATNEAIKQHYRKEIVDALKSELANEAFTSAISEKNVKPLGQPIFSKAELEEPKLILIGSDPAPSKFKCEFTLHVQPEFDLKTYKEYEIPKVSGIPPMEELVQKMVQELRSKNGETRPYGENDFVQDGDNVIVDLKTMIDGENIPSLTGEGEMISIGRINIPGFSESLYGMKIGDIREFDLNMPANHRGFPNKLLHFEVKVNMGSKIEPAALNDDLATKVGIEGGFEKLMEQIRATCDYRVKELESQHNLDQISRRLIDAHDFAIPTWISTSEAEINARNSGKEWNKIDDKEKEQFIDNAAKSVKLSLILQKVREDEPDAQLSDQECIETARANLSKFTPNADQALGEMYKAGQLPLLMGRIKDEFVLKFIEKTCKFTE